MNKYVHNINNNSHEGTTTLSITKFGRIGLILTLGTIDFFATNRNTEHKRIVSKDVCRVSHCNAKCRYAQCRQGLMTPGV